MADKSYTRFYVLSLIGIIVISAYPIYMGIHAVGEMLKRGAVPIETYPKYIIPYTPIAIALILGVLLIPVLQRALKRSDFLFGAIISTGIFFAIEGLMERKILVQAQKVVYLESWQMSLCYIPPEMYRTRTWEAVDVLLGGYSPWFKLHFYIISVVLIISMLNCFYGFAKMIRSGECSRKKALVIQAVTSAAFLGMCIWACFTAFYRRGEITVSALSALLMSVFFILFGITTGLLVGSFTLGKRKVLSVLLPAITASIITLVMYVGEMILLSGNLYSFGKGFLFKGIPGIVLAPVDILIIMASGVITALISKLINREELSPKPASQS